MIPRLHPGWCSFPHGLIQWSMDARIDLKNLRFFPTLGRFVFSMFTEQRDKFSPHIGTPRGNLPKSWVRSAWLGEELLGTFLLIMYIGWMWVKQKTSAKTYSGIFFERARRKQKLLPNQRYDFGRIFHNEKVKNKTNVWMPDILWYISSHSENIAFLPTFEDFLMGMCFFKPPFTTYPPVPHGKIGKHFVEKIRPLPSAICQQRIRYFC